VLQLKNPRDCLPLTIGNVANVAMSTGPGDLLATCVMPQNSQKLKRELVLVVDSMKEALLSIKKELRVMMNLMTLEDVKRRKEITRIGQ